MGRTLRPAKSGNYRQRGAFLFISIVKPLHSIREILESEGALSFWGSRILLFRLVRDGEVHCFPF